MKAGSKWFLLLAVGWLSVSPLPGEIGYPWKDVRIGALDGSEWFGLVLAREGKAAFAFRLKVQKEGETVTGPDMTYLIAELGPHSPDGQYSRLRADMSLSFNRKEQTPILIKPAHRSDTMTLEWCRQGEKTVIGRIRAPNYVELRVEHYLPWGGKGIYRLTADGQIEGESASDPKHYYVFWTDRQGRAAQDHEATGDSLLIFPMQDRQEIYFVAGVGDDLRVLKNHIYRYKNSRTIETFLRDEEERYRNKRVKLDGLFEGAAEAITNSIFWQTLHQPGKDRFYIPASRSSFGTSGAEWMISGWPSFLSPLEAALESRFHAQEAFLAILDTQFPNGNIPGWRSSSSGTFDRSLPPVGSYVGLKLFGRSGNRDFLRTAYPYLKKWHAFWKAPGPHGRPRRDGNGDGLLEWGSDSLGLASVLTLLEGALSGRQRAARESGQANLPNWEEASFAEETGTMTMNCLDLNSLYALDAFCLAQIAGLLGLQEDYGVFLREYEEMKRLINLHLWNEREGFYFDRHWNDRFSTRKAASNFFPLLARIPDEKQALQMVKKLLNPKEFWGDYVIPTISRDDPLFKDQQGWRGMISPATNYLIYQGLKAYGFDAIATQLAQKSCDLFLRSWKNFQLCPEWFDSRTGEASGKRFETTAPLLALMAVEEYIDFTPWDGFRFGILSPEKKGRLSRLDIQDRHYQVVVSPSRVKLSEEEKAILQADGSAVFRRFLYSENEISFEVRSLKKRKIEIAFLKKARYQILVDGQLKNVFRGRSLKFELPEGDHSVVIQLLEELD